MLAEFPRLRNSIPLQLDTVISCQQPLQYQFTIPAFPWNKPQIGKIFLHCAGKEIEFNGMDIHVVNADAEISFQETRLTNIRGLINDDEMVSLDIQIKHSPPTLTISNAIIHGKPNFVESFLFSDNAKRIYQAIWQDVSWDQENLPAIYVPNLIYYEDALNANNWVFSMESELLITNAAYKSFHIPQANITLQLELPGELSITPIVLHTENGDIRAHVNCSFSEIPYCEFAVEETECSPDTILLLQSINDDWDEFLNNFTLHEQSKIRCEGTISFVNPPKITISGTLKAAECTFQKFHLQDLTAHWRYSADRLFWDVQEGKFLTAALQTTGFYDFQAHSGETLLKIRDLPLHKANHFFFPQENNAKSAKLPGLLNSNCRLKLLHNWAGMPLYLEGDGHLNLFKADLWQVPLMGSLNAILSLGTMNFFNKNSGTSLGTISELTADFDFKGTRVVVPNFNTNGTFISLSGFGEYSWENDNLHFRVLGHALKNVNILSFMLKPLSWAFDAELQGSSKKSEWTIRNPLSKVFSTD